MPKRIIQAGVRNPWTTVVLAVMAGLAGFSVNRALEPDPYDPLGAYPVQVVLTRVPGVDGPAVRVGDPITVRATKCNDTPVPVRVHGHLQWQSQVPGGLIGGQADGVATRVPGCETKEFLNEPPGDVLRQMREALERSGGAPVVWAIVGVETPVTDSGVDGVSRPWTTENITVVP